MAEVAIVTAPGRDRDGLCKHLKKQRYRLALMSRSDEIVIWRKIWKDCQEKGSVTERKALDRPVNATIEAFGRVDAVLTTPGIRPGENCLHPASRSGTGDWIYGY